jgi:phosphatidylglycerol:prolipoprotein diacylglycerol transferase
MLAYPDIDPVAVSIGPLKIHWYGLMYIVGIGTAWWLARWRAARLGPDWGKEQIDDLVFYSALGLILGGRLGYVLFYNFSSFLQDPVSLFKVWEGGMSFHGGMLGVLTAVWLYGRVRETGFFTLTDFIAPLVPIGLFFGRIGNFINGELWGKPSDVPWAMPFPGAGPEPRHPSQLYEALLEGLVLFVALNWFARHPRPKGAVSGLFLLLYGIFRFGVEFVRLPDAHIGYLAFGWLTLGQVLTVPMIVAGGWLLALAYRRASLPNGGSRGSQTPENQRAGS